MFTLVSLYSCQPPEEDTLVAHTQDDIKVGFHRSAAESWIQPDVSFIKRDNDDIQTVQEEDQGLSSGDISSDVYCEKELSEEVIDAFSCKNSSRIVLCQSPKEENKVSKLEYIDKSKFNEKNELNNNENKDFLVNCKKIEEALDQNPESIYDCSHVCIEMIE